MSEKERLQALREGKCLTSSELIKKIRDNQKKHGKGVSFTMLGFRNKLKYIYIEKP